MGQDLEKVKAIIKEELQELARDSDIQDIEIKETEEGEVVANVTFGIHIVDEDNYIGLLSPIKFKYLWKN